MAGFVQMPAGGVYQFHIDTPNVAERIRDAGENRRVLSLQLDGDELDAALWGIQNFQKGRTEGPLRAIKHTDNCSCRITRDCAQNTLGARVW